MTDIHRGSSVPVHTTGAIKARVNMAVGITDDLVSRKECVYTFLHKHQLSSAALKNLRQMHQRQAGSVL